MTEIEQSLDAALQDARNEALEEAAKLVDERLDKALADDRPSVAVMLMHLVNCIRTLKS